MKNPENFFWAKFPDYIQHNYLHINFNNSLKIDGSMFLYLDGTDFFNGNRILKIFNSGRPILIQFWKNKCSE